MDRPDPDAGQARRVTALGVALLVLALGPGVSEAQQEGGSASQDTAAASDTAGAVTYRREVFRYPASNRTDPFRPPQAGVTAGPRFEDQSLAGLIYAPEVGSVAILTDGSTGERHRLRDGERLGNFRVVEIRRDAVVFSVQGATGPRREVLQATREEQEENP